MEGSRASDAIARPYPRHSSQRGSIPPPPFSAGALKLSALDNARIYQRLFNILDGQGIGMITEDNGQSDGGAAAEPSSTTLSQSQSQADISAQRRVIRGLLLIDARRLVEASAYLEKLLQDRRMKTWLIHGLIALVCQLTISSQFLSQTFHLNVPTWANFFAYPIAAYRIMKQERGISCTTAVREGAQNLYGIVEKGRPLHDNDLECFTGSEWDETPWEKMGEEL